MELAERGLRVLCLDREASAGRGNNRCAIGGIRATHSEPAKVSLCLRSLEVFGSWEETYGDDIGWREGGYCYVAYDDRTRSLLRGIVSDQRKAGLSITWNDPSVILELVPGIREEGLLGGTYSPHDGSANPMQACYAFHRRAANLGAEFGFGETVLGLEAGESRAMVRTDRGEYECGSVVNCAGSHARDLGSMVGVDLPVNPDSHEAGITEPVEIFFGPMVVDIRKGPGSANYYFYQHATGQVVFCITPDPVIPGTDDRETSEFLPMVSRRMVDLYPRLGNLKVRRTWRGCYPQTPDGSPILGRCGSESHYVAVGMCGQGFMLGPGVASLMARLITGESTSDDAAVLRELGPDRDFGSEEALK
ncbi:FAD-dependent oxidoreductase [Candidatus Fermentibacteria bacterium]|nr:FAD-dependent oxidoreductase [Candidatus Fermentibacteria bacterium]